MRALFCEVTSDISLFLSEKEIQELRRIDGSCRVLSASNHGLEFSLMNCDKPYYIRVHEPREIKGFPSYTIVINDSAYNDLVRNGRCGTRYGDSSKIHVIRESE